MLPRDVEELVPADLAGVSRRESGAHMPGDDDLAALVRWLLSPEAALHAPVRRYLFYLRGMATTFRQIAEQFPIRNPGRGGQKDAHGLATSPRELLYLANHLYLLDSFGVPGVLLECGAFKGYSSCCLSHACAALGRTLVIADSFAGLPEPDRATEGQYEAGDFAGSLAEVRENLATYGRPAVAEFRQGWFSDSLRGWDRPIALLWTDVDLYRSTLDVLEPCFAALDPRGAIFSHEMPARAIADWQIVFPTETPGAYLDFLTARQIRYTASHLHHYLGAITLPDSVAPRAGQFLGALLTTWPDDPLSPPAAEAQAADLAARLVQTEGRLRELEATYDETVAWARSLEAQLAALPAPAPSAPPARGLGERLARITRRKD